MSSRVSRFGQNLSPYETGYSHAPVVEKARGLLGSRANSRLPDTWLSGSRGFPDQLMRFHFDIRKLGAVSLLWTAFAQGVSATGVEPAKDMRVDPALCLAAALARDDDKTVAACGALIDNAKTEKADRIKALIARGAAYERKEMAERAIADYDGVLRLDPSLADIHNTQRRTLAQEGRPAEGGGGFCRGDQTEPGPRYGQSQPPGAGAGAGAVGRAKGDRRAVRRILNRKRGESPRSGGRTLKRNYPSFGTFSIRSAPT